MFSYPEVHRGDEIDFAPSEDTPEPMWVLGTIERTKNESVDIKTSDGRRYMDVWHVGDPRLSKGPQRKNTGVFKLVNRQIKINRMIAEHEAAKRREESLIRRMNALEETFRAVIASQGLGQSQIPGDNAPSPAMSGRKSVRPTAAAPV